MERKKHLTIVIILFVTLISTITVTAQKQDSIFYKCYVTGDMETWENTMKQMEIEYKNSTDYEQMFDLTLAWYGYIGYCIGNKLEDEAENYLESGWKHLERLLATPEAGAAAIAMKSGFYGFEMGLAKYKAMILGPKSVSALKEAASIDSTNVHYRVEKGNQMYYMPSFLGGDKKVALHQYKKAVEAMEKGKAYHRKHWFYLNTLVVLAHTYEGAGYIDKARATFRKIMKQAPEFEWLNEELWPKFVEKHGD